MSTAFVFHPDVSYEGVQTIREAKVMPARAPGRRRRLQGIVARQQASVSTAVRASRRECVNSTDFLERHASLAYLPN
jgi:hypothetical protein